MPVSESGDGSTGTTDGARVSERRVDELDLARRAVSNDYQLRVCVIAFKKRCALLRAGEAERSTATKDPLRQPAGMSVDE